MQVRSIQHFTITIQYCMQNYNFQLSQFYKLVSYEIFLAFTCDLWIATLLSFTTTTENDDYIFTENDDIFQILPSLLESPEELCCSVFLELVKVHQETPS